jgi:hypothetical protein
MSYEGFFIRNNVGDVPNNPKNSNWTNSPDIICSGPDALADPNSIVNIDNYNKGIPFLNKQTPKVNNWVYVRGINPLAVPQTSTIFLYFVDTSIVLWPQNWKYAEITYANRQQNFVQIQAPANTNNNGIAGTIVPFGWTPPNTNTHYCLVGWANNGPDQLTPPDLLSIGTVNDMGKFIINHPNVGWKNTQEVQATQPTFQGSAPIKGPSAGGLLYIGLQFSKMPTDGEFQFSVPGPNAENTIVYPRTRIVSSNQTIMLTVEYPATPGGFQTSLAFSYFKGATTPPDGSSIVPVVGTDELSLVALATKRAPHLLSDAFHFGTPTEFNALESHNSILSAPPKKILVVGSVPFSMKS